MAPKQLVPICSALKETLTRQGEGACEPASRGVPDTRGDVPGVRLGAAPPGRRCELALRI